MFPNINAEAGKLCVCRSKIILLANSKVDMFKYKIAVNLSKQSNRHRNLFENNCHYKP